MRINSTTAILIVGIAAAFGGGMGLGMSGFVTAAIAWTAIATVVTFCLPFIVEIYRAKSSDPEQGESHDLHSSSSSVSSFKLGTTSPRELELGSTRSRSSRTLESGAHLGQSQSEAEPPKQDQRSRSSCDLNPGNGPESESSNSSSKGSSSYI